MNPEKHGINMELKNVSHLREFEREFERDTERERDRERGRERVL